MPAELVANAPLLAAVLGGLTVALATYAVLARRPRAAVLGAAPVDDNPLRQMLHVVPGLGGFALAFVPRSALDELEARYRQAGEPGRIGRPELALSALLAGIGAAFVASIFLMLLAGGLWWALGIAGLILGPTMVASHLGTLGKKRIVRIRQALPYALDMLVLATRSGCSLPLALERCARDYAGNPLSEEFEWALVDMQMGATRRTAFESMLRRAPIEEMRSFVDTVLVAEELGRPVSDALEQLSDRLQATRVQSAESSAGAAGVYVALPTMLVFIAVLILLFSPFVVKFMVGGYQL